MSDLVAQVINQVNTVETVVDRIEVDTTSIETKVDSIKIKTDTLKKSSLPYIVITDISLKSTASVVSVSGSGVLTLIDSDQPSGVDKARFKVTVDGSSSTSPLILVEPGETQPNVMHSVFNSSLQVEIYNDDPSDREFKVIYNLEI